MRVAAVDGVVGPAFRPLSLLRSRCRVRSQAGCRDMLMRTSSTTVGHPFYSGIISSAE